MSRNYNSSQIRSAPKVMNTILYNSFPSTDVRTQVVDPTGKHAGLGLPVIIHFNIIYPHIIIYFARFSNQRTSLFYI